MKNFRLVASFLFLGFILAAVPAMASQQVNTLGGYGPYQTGSGGEFTLQVSQDLLWVLNRYSNGVTKNVSQTTNTFQTFCLEGAEHINTGRTYNVQISSTASYGGVGITGDPISLGTAWLYSQFATGNLAVYDANNALFNYDYVNPGRSGSSSTSAALLQNTIWWLEGEQSISYLNSNPFMHAVVDQFGSQSNAMGNNNGTYNVAVLNMIDTRDGSRGQDQLVMVPEPSVLISLGICLIGIAIVIRKFKIQA